ncbi:MAG: hypothetical protein JXB20_01050 [Bacilli bacterium]|nr:hypothetical protein [Bacilli bacterium]MBN2696809.1 hypothetical protein [Bacilli bacterium]
MMKKVTKIFLTTIVLVAGIFVSIDPVIAENQVDIYFFYDDACSHCVEENEFLDQMEMEYDFLTVNRYEVLESDYNRELFSDVKEAFSRKSTLTPFLVIGGVALAGYSEQTEIDIVNLIERYHTESHVDVVGKIIAGEEIQPEDIEFLRFSPGDYVTLPLIGAVEIDSLSLFAAAMVIGFVDGFNPCAMWILLFLITMLLNMKNKVRRWLLGLTFILTSALVYFLIMVAWLNIGLTVSAVIWVRILIAIVAFTFGCYSIFKYIQSGNKSVGCEVTDAKQQSKIRIKLDKIVHERNLFIALGGIVLLAASVNLLELACSAGLPLLYTQILAYNQLPVSLYYIYILVYIFFFLLDDVIIFSIAMITLQVSGISNRYARLSHLIGGLIMVAIGVMLAFFPQLIMLR